MKKLVFTIATLLICAFGVNAQTKKDGTPDMRYNSNKQTYSNTYSTPSTTTYSTSTYSTPTYSAPTTYSTPTTYSAPKVERTYDNGGQYKVQDGYQRSNGTYVAPHIKTTPDNSTNNNYRRKN